jgi:hypothetical protein
MAESDQQQPLRGGNGMASTGASDEVEARAARVARWFDIRRIISALFVVYGVVMVLTGLVGSHQVKTKAAGINIDLWTGIVMVVFGILMGAWALWRPTGPEPEETRGHGSGRIRRAPAT